MLENNVNQEKGNRPETALGLPHLGRNSSFKQYSKVGYEDAKTWMERRLVCVFLASGYGWGTVMHEIPISSAHLVDIPSIP
jgi:hypothetical protein